MTCILNKKSHDMYFEKLLRGGRLDKEGKRSLGSKYYLSDKQYKKLALLTLQETKLHFIEDKE